VSALVVLTPVVQRLDPGVQHDRPTDRCDARVRAADTYRIRRSGRAPAVALPGERRADEGAVEIERVESAARTEVVGDVAPAAE
jgi:hypothetical protein